MEEKRESNRQLRGLYSRVNISVRTLNIIITVLCAALLACIAFGIANRGFTVTFNSMGGTPVESQRRMYGELLEESEAPSREGYVFSGWYREAGLETPWNPRADIVTESMTLYAGWEEP